jgi:3-oxoacyl-[acyl-carrier-protein] synthase I
VKARAFVTSFGVRSALGQGAAETCFLLRTGIPVLAAAPLVNGEGEPITMGFDATLDPYLVGGDRAAKLAMTALEEALAPVVASREALTAKLVLCVDPPLAGVARDKAVEDGGRLAAVVHTRAKELCPGVEMEIVARGGASAAFALSAALEALADKELDLLVLGGVHSDYDPSTIAALDAQGRVFSPQNLDALIPGEAAAFVVLTREETARRIGQTPPARLGGVGTAVGAPRADDDSSAMDGTALTSALRAASEDLDELGLKAGWAICDHTFEVRRVLEWQSAVTRTHKMWCEPHRLDAPAQRMGYLGAAALPFAMIMAAEGFSRGHAPSGVAMAFGGSDMGERGAVLLFSNV